jgi:UDP-2,3-diacylglucosamine pyrophosphatase LpxH
MVLKNERAYTFKALDATRRAALHISDYQLKTDRYVILSDVHKGDGNRIGDDFLHNVQVYANALRYYLDHGYRLILNGDIEECWKARNSAIIEAHESGAFAMEREFARQGESHYLRIYGNHDDDWADPAKVDRYLRPVLGPVNVYSGVLLGERILITHGHQGDPNADRRAWFSRRVVRHCWKPIQRGFKLRINFAAENNLILGKRDRLLQDWAKANRLLLIAGHTHRPMFRPMSKMALLHAVREWLSHYLDHTADAHMRRLLPVVIEQISQVIQVFDDEKKLLDDSKPAALESVPYYLNGGACIHTNGITGIEIDRGEIRLVRWATPTPQTVPESASGDYLKDAYGLERKVYQSGDLGEILYKLSLLANLPLAQQSAMNQAMPPALQEISLLTGLANIVLP